MDYIFGFYSGEREFLIYLWFGSKKTLEYLTAYLLEKSLSFDNLFVFLIIFSYFDAFAILGLRALYFVEKNPKT